PALRQVFRKRLRCGQHVAGDLAKLAEKGELTPAVYRRMAADDAIHYGGARSRQPHDENGLRDIRALLRTRHPGDVVACEELLEATKQGFYGVRLVLQAA